MIKVRFEFGSNELHLQVPARRPASDAMLVADGVQGEAKQA
jgi:hypothetical protein